MPSRQLTDIQLQDLSSVKELPDSYTWNQLDEDYPLITNESLPVIDLQDPNAINLVGHACRTWGAFQIINHGVPTSLFHDVEGISKNLFSLPAQQKQKVARSPDSLSGYGLARISPFFSKLMWYEGFTIAGGSLVEHFRQLWPRDYTTYWYYIIFFY